MRDRGDAIDIHIRRILHSDYFRDKPRRRLKIGIDACNGAASLAATKLVQELGSQAFDLFCSTEEGGCFPRLPEPTAEHLEALSRFVRERKLDLGVAFDPDGDRFSCVDEQGKPLGEEASVMLATDFVLHGSQGNGGRQSLDNARRGRRCGPLRRCRSFAAGSARRPSSRR